MVYTRKGTPTVHELKKLLRADFREKRRAIPFEKRAELSAEICKRLLSLAAYRFSDIVLSYSPVTGEVDISDFNRAVLASGKRLAFPRCIPGEPRVNFHYVKSLDELAKGAWSIKEPREDSEIWESGHGSTVCILPGMAFDRDGYRLGYGKGYYDRFLSSNQMTKVGVVYSEFIVDSLPRGRFDLSVDVIVTERNIKAIGRN